MSTAVISTLFAFAWGWHLALVISLFMPIFSYVSSFTLKGFILIGTETAKSYAKAGGIASQTFSLLKTIKCSNQEAQEITSYNSALNQAESEIIKHAKGVGVSMGSVNFVQMLLYAVGLGTGAYLILNEVEVNG